MSLPALDFLGQQTTPVKKAVRRLRWFRRAFLEQTSSVSRATGIAFDVNTTRLTEAFFDWCDEFERRKPASPTAKRRFVDFASGLMLRRLLEHAPLTAQPGGAAAPETPAGFWPEGFACTVFCLNLRQAVLAQEYGESPASGAAVDDLRGWWSFRENFDRDTGLAIPYLQYFAGLDPDWNMPDAFTAPIPGKAGTGRTHLRVVANADGGAGAAGGGEPVARLPSGLRNAVFDLAAISNSRAVVAGALRGTLLVYGLEFDDAEIARLTDAPLAASATKVGLRVGRICPSRFAAGFQRSLADGLRMELTLHAHARETLDALLAAGLAVEIASGDDKLPPSGLPAGLDLPAGVRIPEATGARAFDAACLFVATDAARLNAARAQGAYTVAVGAAHGHAADCRIDDFSRFPRPSV